MSRRDESWRTIGLAALACVLPPLLVASSGAFRFELGVSLTAGLFCALPLLVLAAWWVSRRWTPSGSVAGVVLLLLSLIVSEYLLIHWLYFRAFDGMPNGLGPDVGYHLQIYNEFTLRDPRAYQGCIAMYTLMYWFRVFAHSGVFKAFRFTFYYVVACVPLATTLAGGILFATAPTRRAFVARVLISIPVTALVIWYAIFPLLHYYQQDGFYTQLFALVPFLLVWLLFATQERPLERGVLCAVGVVVSRYCYGLNLGDIALTLAILIFAEAVAWTSLRVRLAGYLGALVFCLVAVAALANVYPLTKIDGLFIRYDFQQVNLAQLLASILLLFLLQQAKGAGIEVSSQSSRLIRFASCFSLVSWTVQLVFVQLGGPQIYYFFKYNLFSLIVLGIVWIPVLSVMLTELGSRLASLPRHRLPVILLIGAWLFESVSLVKSGLAVYQAQAESRADEKPTAETFWFYDAFVDKQIKRVLAEKQASFGGFYDWFFPFFLFTNNLYDGFASRRVEFGTYKSQPELFLIRPNRCYFWTDDDDMPYRKQINELNYDRSPDCMTFDRKWDSKQHFLCYTCTPPAPGGQPFNQQ